MPLSIYKQPRKPRHYSEPSMTIRELQQKSLENLQKNKPGLKPSATKKRKKRK